MVVPIENWRCSNAGPRLSSTNIVYTMRFMSPWCHVQSKLRNECVSGPGTTCESGEVAWSGKANNQLLVRLAMGIMCSRSNVRKVSVNSTPEKMPRNKKCTVDMDLRSPKRSWTDFPRSWTDREVVDEDMVSSRSSSTGLLSVFLERRVSGSAMARKTVSRTRRTSVMAAGVA